MILGFIRVQNGAIVTHRKTFVLSPLTNWEVDQPFWIPAILLGTALTGFTAAFSDLLYPIEIISILIACVFSIVIGWQVGQLRLHGSSLRGTTYGQALWGRFASLQEVRADIDAKLGTSRMGDS